MRFLCVDCDEQMKLYETRGPDRGSVSLVYACPVCGRKVAMLTNPHETQVVSSLGVTIGGAGSADETAQAASRCPFTGMLKEMEGAADAEQPSAEPAASARPARAGVYWTREAQDRLGNIPPTIRDMARSGIEKFAVDHGYDRVDVEVLERARGFFGL
ncbi:MAG TPA: PCP reductase family protein [Thermoanaerobaculia bacterium]|nr:PCP reductase family protein [Thermoanaerobaculia bacterium]